MTSDTDTEIEDLDDAVASGRVKFSASKNGSGIKYPNIDGLIVLFEHNYKEDGFAMFIGVDPGSRDHFEVRYSACSCWCVTRYAPENPQEKWEQALQKLFEQGKEVAEVLAMNEREMYQERGKYVAH